MGTDIRTRFAPSPTGFLHIGGVRTALYNYLLAKHHGGTFVLRLEDTDRERFVPEGVEQIVEALDWLNLKPDEGFWISGGKHQNVEYVQSERQKTGIYQKYADQLVQKGLAYYSPTTPKELEVLREQAKKDKKPFLYKRGDDPKNTDNQLKNVPIRLDISRFFQSPAAQSKDFSSGKVIWTEGTGKKVEWSSNLVDDFIIMKGDGFPTYNFANVVDDHEMRISHAMRGNEFISSTPKHIILYRALGFDSMPVFVHLPVINGTDGKKLSKRTGDTNALEYRNKGYLPEALLNFLALLGWNDGTEQETFPIGELQEKFSLERVHSSPAVFDNRRLDWMNGQYIRQMSLDNLYELVERFWPKEAAGYDNTYKQRVLELVQERLKYFGELPELTRFFFADLPDNPQLITSHKQLKIYPESDLKTYLMSVRVELEPSDFSPEDLTKRLNGLLSLTHTKPAMLFSLIRIATTQAPASPGLADTLAVLGKEVVLRRIDKQLTVFG